MKLARPAVIALTVVAVLAPGVAAYADTGPVGPAPAASTSAGPPRPVEPRTPGSKPAHTRVAASQARDVVRVKFTEDSGVRIRNGRLVSTTGRDLGDVERALGGSMAEATRLFTGSEQELTDDASRVSAQSGRQQADLNLYLRLRLRPGTDAAALLDRLNAVDLVEIAYPEDLPAPLPVTPSYLPYQGYRSAGSAGGIDADYAATVTGGTGAYVKVHDIEYAWNAQHEDLSKLRTAYFPNGTYSDPFNNDDHGTAVIGEIAGDPNGLGVTGMVPDVTLQVTNSGTTSGTNIGNAVRVATSNLSAGDVILIEQQAVGANGGCGADQVGCVAVEWIPDVYDAIVSATSQGIVVVEAAGNGYQNLDGAEYGTVFPRGKADSGAIIVGAGGSGGTGCNTARSRLGYSDYGRRVDLQGWGECIVTSGYGNLQNAGHNAMYTQTFGGTSGASPIVASAAASLSSVAEARGIRLTPRDVRARLRATGTAQVFGTAGNIGPLPNLRAAIAGLSTTDTTAPSVSLPASSVPAGVSVDATVPVTTTWSASDASGIAAFSIYLQTNAGSWVQQTAATTTSTSIAQALTPGSTYRYAVAARDGAGNWSDYSYGPTFGLGMWQENSGYVSYSTGWASNAWASASGGYLNTSATTSASASFTFTGRNVAWVGTRATNRGQAYVYLDGAYFQTLDLYAASTQARAVLASYTWATAGTHTMKVVVAGTSGRPTVDVDAFVRLS